MSDKTIVQMAAIIVFAFCSAISVVTISSNLADSAKYEAISALHYTPHQTDCILHPPPFSSRCDDVKERP